MGGVLVNRMVHEAFMVGAPESVEPMHGYTYSGHPLACAAGIAALGTYEEDGVFAQGAAILPTWETAAHTLRGMPHVIDICTIGLLAAIELAPRSGAAGERGAACLRYCLDNDILISSSGDTLVLSPPLIIRPEEIERLFATIGAALDRLN